MKTKNIFQKIALIALTAAVLVSPAISQTTLAAPRQEKLLNGLKILMWSDARADKVTVKIRIHSGSAFDPQGREGVMQMLADNIFPNQVSRDFFREDLGGDLEIVTNYDYIQVNASSKPESFLTMIETLSAAVSNPTIDKETTANLRTALLAKLKTLEADPAYVADQAVAKRLFGTFPYGRPQMGSSASVQKIDFADLTDAKQRFLTADNATITISGNFDTALGYKAVRRLFGGWLKSDKLVPSTFTQPDPPPSEILSVPSQVSDVATYRFAIRGVSRGSKDLAASLIFTAIIQNRLLSRVSSRSGNNFSINNEYHMLPGIITLGFRAEKDSAGWGIGKTEANEIVRKMFLDPIAEAEFQAAKSSTQALWQKREIYSFWLDTDTYRIADMKADMRIIDNATLSDVNAYAERARQLPIAGILVANPPQPN